MREARTSPMTLVHPRGWPRRTSAEVGLEKPAFAGFNGDFCAQINRYNSVKFNLDIRASLEVSN